MTTIRQALDQARAAADRGDFEAAITLLGPLAEGEHAEAQYQLGSLAFTECDLISGRKAFALLRSAADQGYADAMHRIATFPVFIREPFTSPLSDEEACNWLVKAAESGCVQAQYDAGASLAKGDCE